MSKSLLEKVTLSNRRANPKALALLDVLIGMAIFALIAVIAVIALGQFRQRAFMTGAVEDVRSVGLALEGASTSDGVYPADNGLSTDANRKVTVTAGGAAVTTLTKGNQLRGYDSIPATASAPAGFQVCVVHMSGTTVDSWGIYNSLNGGVTDKGEGPLSASAATACPAPAPPTP